MCDEHQLIDAVHKLYPLARMVDYKYIKKNGVKPIKSHDNTAYLQTITLINNIAKNAAITLHYAIDYDNYITLCCNLYLQLCLCKLTRWWPEWL